MIPRTRFYQMSNSIFQYGLTPIQLAVYSYLVSCAGAREMCWPAMGTIAFHCGCSKNAARSAADELARRGFLRKRATYRTRADGRSHQTNNTYFILGLPSVPLPAPRGGWEVYQEDEDSKE